MQESAYTTSVTRTVTNNRPPVISGTDGALGSFSTAAPSYEYTVTDFVPDRAAPSSGKLPGFWS